MLGSILTIIVFVGIATLISLLLFSPYIAAGEGIKCGISLCIGLVLGLIIYIFIIIGFNHSNKVMSTTYLEIRGVHSEYLARTDLSELERKVLLDRAARYNEDLAEIKVRVSILKNWIGVKAEFIENINSIEPLR